MTTYETIKKFEKELTEIQYKIDDLEDKKQELEDKIGWHEDELSMIENNIKLAEANLTESDPNYRRYWGEKLICDYKKLQGQYKFQDQYAVSNGYLMVVFNEPIEGMPFCEGISLDLFKNRVRPLSVKTSEIEEQQTEYLEIGDAQIDRDFFTSVKKFLRLDDTAQYSNLVIDRCVNVMVKCSNGEKAIILGRRK